MDYADHGSLDKWVERVKQRGMQLTTAQLVGLGIELCDCLTALHDYEVVHYDLKPHNVLIRGPGDTADHRRGRDHRLPSDQALMLGDLGMALVHRGQWIPSRNAVRHGS